MRLLAMTLTILALATMSPMLNADESPKRSPELQVLDRFAGTWDLVVTVKPIGGTATTEKTSEVRQWSLGGRFIHFQNPKLNQPDQPEFHMLVTYDPATKSYPGMLMNGASRTFVDGTWDEATKTMRFRGTFPDNALKFDFKNRFVDENQIETSGSITNSSGDVLSTRFDVQTRRKDKK